MRNLCPDSSVAGIVSVLAILLMAAGPLRAQNVTLSGTVTDSENGEVLIGAHITAVSSGRGAASNAYGFYSLTLPASDSVTVVYSFLGFEPAVRKIRLLDNVRLDIELDPRTTGMAEVTVTAENLNDFNVSRTRTGIIEVPIQVVERFPAILGEQDVLKVLQLLPGVQAGNEGTTGFHVRGGNVDQNLVQLDEATVYNPSHLFGLFSTFNTRALNDVKLVKGGFPAQYGGRLSSVVEITMRDGNRKRYEGQGGIGLVASHATVEGPTIRDKGSFIVSARRSYLDLIARPLQKQGQRNLYYFYDVNAKVNHRLSNRDRLFVSYFRGRDVADYVDVTGLGYGVGFGNSTGTVRWNHIFGSKLFSNVSLIRNSYFLRVSTVQGPFYSENYSAIEDRTAKAELQWYPGRGHQVRLGATWMDHEYSATGTDGEVIKDFVIPELNTNRIVPRAATETAFWLNDQWELSDRFGLNLGLRLPRYKTDDARYSRVEPRVSARLNLDPQSSLKASWTVMHQFAHLVPSTTASLPTDIWIPSSSRSKPQRSEQWAIGIFRNFQDNEWETSLEIYTKSMDHQVLFREGTQLYSYIDIDNELTYGKGWSRGLELLVRRNSGRLTGWVSYTLSRTEQEFPELNAGIRFPFRYDRRHNLAATTGYDLNDRWTLSANFVFQTGAAYTLPLGRVYSAQAGDLYAGLFYDYESLNNYRMRSYHRMDVAATYSLRPKRVRRSELVFSAYNIYSRLNPYYVFLDLDLNTGEPLGKEVSLLPIIPAVTWNLWF